MKDLQILKQLPNPAFNANHYICEMHRPQKPCLRQKAVHMIK